MKRVPFLIAISSVLLFTQCQTAYWVQLNKVSSANCKEISSGFIFENDSVSVEYIFKGENGNMLFTITNKLDVPLYVDWKKCNYIINNNRNKYYDENETIVTNGSSASINYMGNFSYSKYGSVSTVKKQERITFLPPKTTVINQASGINNEIMKLGTSKSAKVKPAFQRFDQQTSPVILRNYLTFSLKEDFKDEFMMDHLFYLSAIENAHENNVSELAMDKETMTSYMKEINLDGKTFFVRYSK